MHEPKDARRLGEVHRKVWYVLDRKVRTPMIISSRIHDALCVKGKGECATAVSVAVAEDLVLGRVHLCIGIPRWHSKSLLLDNVGMD